MSINGNEMKLDAVNMERDLGITFDKRLEFVHCSTHIELYAEEIL